MNLSLIEDFGNDLNKGHGLKVFDYTLVVAATNGFSSENKLGQGGFGPVYKVIETTKLCVGNFVWEDYDLFVLISLGNFANRRGGCYKKTFKKFCRRNC